MLIQNFDTKFEMYKNHRYILIILSAVVKERHNFNCNEYHEVNEIHLTLTLAFFKSVTKSGPK